MANYLQDRGELLAGRVTVRPYDWRTRIEAHRGPQVFAALDQLTPAELDGVALLRSQLANLAPTTALLNDPRRSLGRKQLLERLADAGLNSFRAFPADQSEPTWRFPVFVREDRGHGGSLTELLGSARELRRALRALQLRGFGRKQLLIVEYCDTSDSSGLFRKYSAFRIGDAIIPSHLMSSRDWSVKSESTETTVQMLQEEMAYQERNPYEAWLRQVFSLAGIEYGRIDFGVLAGRPQAWEINTNPTIGRNPHTPRKALPLEVRELRTRTRDGYHERLRKAFEALDQKEETGTLEVRFDSSLVHRIASDTRRAARRQKALRVLHRVYDLSWAAPVRALVRRYLPWPKHVGHKVSSSR